MPGDLFGGDIAGFGEALDSFLDVHRADSKRFSGQGTLETCRKRAA
jgi:hypothetical protein